MKPRDRSMNAELLLGATDGTVKRVVRDRGGLPENTQSVNLHDRLDPLQYGAVRGADGLSQPVGDGRTAHVHQTLLEMPAVVR